MILVMANKNGSRHCETIQKVSNDRMVFSESQHKQFICETNINLMAFEFLETKNVNVR